MNLLVFGSTGLVGSGVLREALVDPAFCSVTAVLRTGKSLAPDTTAQNSPKLIKLRHDNFLDYSSEEILNSFKQKDLVCVWALGISLTKVTTNEEFTTITHDYVMAAAKKMIDVNRGGVRLLHITGEVADSSEQSRSLLARVKGRTENDLAELSSGFQDLYNVRPGAIFPMHGNPGATFCDKCLYPLVWAMKSTRWGINTVELSKVLLELAKNGDERKLLRNRELKELVREKKL